MSNETTMGRKRFVVLHHTGYGREHWDLMLEEQKTLATWKLYHWQMFLHQEPIELFRIGDHRKVYLDYEGDISGGRGAVRRVCQGDYELLKKEQNCWQVLMNSEVIAGKFEIRFTEQDRWLWKKLG